RRNTLRAAFPPTELAVIRDFPNHLLDHNRHNDRPSAGSRPATRNDAAQRPQSARRRTVDVSQPAAWQRQPHLLHWSGLFHCHIDRQEAADHRNLTPCVRSSLPALRFGPRECMLTTIWKAAATTGSACAATCSFLRYQLINRTIGVCSPSTSGNRRSP